LAFPLQKYTANTITTFEALQETLEMVAANGFAIALEEYESGFGAISAPIFDHDEHVVAAVAVSAPSFRLSKATFRQFVPCLHETAAAISAELGYRNSS
jgi:DNA-binding IclR family transcriptional regulator